MAKKIEIKGVVLTGADAPAGSEGPTAQGSFTVSVDGVTQTLTTAVSQKIVSLLVGAGVLS